MKTKYVLLLVLGFGAICSCSNPEHEARIQELEERITGLEKRVESMSAVLSGRQLMPEAANATKEQAKGLSLIHI